MTRVLSVGRSFPDATKTVGWFDPDPNVKDYEVVFLDYPSLEEKDTINEDETTQIVSFGTKDIVRHCVVGNDLVVYLPSTTQVSVSNRWFDLLEWMPNILGLTNESGNSVDSNSIHEEWSWYFQGDEFEWHFHLPDSDSIRTVGDDIGFETNPLVKNIYQRAIAAEIRITNAKSSTLNDYYEGSIFLLPIIEGWNYEDLSTHILRRNILGVGEYPKQEESPDWTESYTVPGEEDTLENISKLETNISKLEQELNDEKSNLREIREYKTLLFGNDDELESIVPKVFEEMGFTVEGETPHGEDGSIHLDNHTIILEITGTTGGISQNKCAQVDRRVRNYQMENPDGNFVGILIVNPFRDTDPEQRSGYLSPDVEKIMNRWDHKILTTHKLFNLFEKYRNGEISKKDIEEKLIGGETVLDT